MTMKIIIQDTTKLPIHKEEVDVDIQKHSILFYQAYQPVNTLRLRGKFYIYVDFEFKVEIDSNQDVWIIPVILKELEE